MCHAQEHTPRGLEEDCFSGPLVLCLVLVRWEGLQGSSQGRTLTITDNLLLAPNTSHITSSPTVAQDSVSALAFDQRLKKRGLFSYLNSRGKKILTARLKNGASWIKYLISAETHFTLPVVLRHCLMHWPTLLLGQNFSASTEAHEGLTPMFHTPGHSL